MVEETDCLVSQFGDVNQSFRIRMTVDQRICQEVSTLLRIKNVHCSEMVESGLDADHFFGNFDGVAFEHLVVGFFVCKAFAGTFFGKDAWVAFAAFRLVRMAEIDDFDAFQAQVEFFGQFADCFVVS